MKPNLFFSALVLVLDKEREKNQVTAKIKEQRRGRKRI